MNRKPFLKSLSEGRGNCPLPSRTHPQKQNLVVYTEELTYLYPHKQDRRALNQLDNEESPLIIPTI
jgi:hypothetical protein